MMHRGRRMVCTLLVMMPTFSDGWWELWGQAVGEQAHGGHKRLAMGGEGWASTVVCGMHVVGEDADIQ
jgi:hypothetical protein